MNYRRTGFILAGPLFFFISKSLLTHAGCPPTAAHVGGVATWMCVWWFSEALNFGVTALIPLLLFPLGKIGSPAEVASRYTDPVIFLFFGGFALAFALEKWGLHRRLSLGILALTGTGKTGILCGIMLCTFLISNWISNTATTIMLFSMVMALLEELSPFIHKNPQKLHAGILLGLAFSATIGGMATPVGTPPNMFFYTLFQKHYENIISFNFSDWIQLAFPIALMILLFTFVVLYVCFIRPAEIRITETQLFREKKKSLGKWKREEVLVLIIFLFCIFAWVLRGDIKTNTFHFRGWQHWHPMLNAADDSTVAILASLLLFTLPSTVKGRHLLEWEDAKKIRYDIILMFGSGFALAYGFEQSGLNTWIAGNILLLKDISPFWLVVFICFIVTLISEFASNIASIQLCLPLLMSVQKELRVDPLLLMVPATLAASVGFILPVATAANTIVFGSGHIRMKDMIRAGWILDIFCIFCIAVFCYFYFQT